MVLIKVFRNVKGNIVRGIGETHIHNNITGQIVNNKRIAGISLNRRSVDSPLVYPVANHWFSRKYYFGSFKHPAAGTYFIITTGTCFQGGNTAIYPGGIVYRIHLRRLRRYSELRIGAIDRQGESVVYKP